MEHPLDEDVSVVQLDRSARYNFPNELGEAVAALELLAERYGKQIMVGPI